MTKVNPKKGNETKSDFFAWHIFKSDVISFLSKMLGYFSDFKNQHFSVF